MAVRHPRIRHPTCYDRTPWYGRIRIGADARTFGGTMGISTGNLRATAAVFAFALVAAVPIGGCASGYHHSQVVGWRYFKTNLDTYSVSINQVDGLSYLGGHPCWSTPARGPSLFRVRPVRPPRGDARLCAGRKTLYPLLPCGCQVGSAEQRLRRKDRLRGAVGRVHPAAAQMRSMNRPTAGNRENERS